MNPRVRHSTKYERRAVWRGKIVVEAVSTNSHVYFHVRWKPGVPGRGPRIFGRMGVSKRGHVVQFAKLYAHKGMGIGEYLYTAALEHFGELKTKYHDHSPDARRVWEKLMRHRAYAFRGAYLTVYDQRVTYSRQPSIPNRTETTERRTARRRPAAMHLQGL